MEKITITKYCNQEKQKKSSANTFEKKFEQYIESKVKKIRNNPQKYPFITIIDNGE